MTRDEAIRTIDQVYGQPYRGGLSEGAMRISAASGLADALFALGVLKLDEPMSAEQEAVRVLAKKGWTSQFVEHLREAGFKIVKA